MHAARIRALLCWCRPNTVTVTKESNERPACEHVCLRSNQHTVFMQYATQIVDAHSLLAHHSSSMQLAAACRVRQLCEPQGRMRCRDGGRAGTGGARRASAVRLTATRTRPREQLRRRVEIGHGVARRDGCVPSGRT